MSITTLVQTFEDVYISSSQPNFNFRKSDVLWIGKQTRDIVYRTLIKFDLSFIPEGSTIISSNLNLYSDYDSSDLGNITTIMPYAISESWDPATVTWNNQPAIDGVLVGTRAEVSTEGYFSWMVTDIINQFVNGEAENNGLELRAEEVRLLESKRFVSSNETDLNKQALKPVLVIQYSSAQQAPFSIETAVSGGEAETVHEEVVTTDTYQATAAKETSDKVQVSFFVSNLTTNKAVVGIEVSSDGVEYQKEQERTITQGVVIFVPSYYSTYSRVFYKSGEKGNPTTLSIDYVAQG